MNGRLPRLGRHAIYWLFGGMVATTWVQINQSGVLLLLAVTLLTALVLSQSRFALESHALWRSVTGQAALEPGGLVTDPIDAGRWAWL